MPGSNQPSSAIRRLSSKSSAQPRSGPLIHSRDRHREAGLRSLEQLARDMAVEQFADDVLALAVAQLEVERDARGQLRDAMIEERHARLEADGHRRAVDLAEDVVRQIGHRVAVHDPQRVGRRRTRHRGRTGS